MRYNPDLIKNIYYMLAYAFDAVELQGFENIRRETFDNIHNLFAAILANGISLLLKHGLYREYSQKQEDMPVLKGKIDLQKTIQLQMMRKQKLKCRYDELTENNLLNRILKTTMLLLVRSDDVEHEYKDKLKKELLFFGEITELD